MIKIDIDLIAFKIMDKNRKYNSECRKKEK